MGWSTRNSSSNDRCHAKMLDKAIDLKIGALREETSKAPEQTRMPQLAVVVLQDRIPGLSHAGAPAVLTDRTAIRRQSNRTRQRVVDLEGTSFVTDASLAFGSVVSYAGVTAQLRSQSGRLLSWPLPLRSASTSSTGA